MQIELWSLGKESSKLLEAGIEEYTKRINRYHSFKLVYIDNTKVPKNLPKEQLMDKEAELIFAKLGEKDLLIDVSNASITNIKAMNSYSKNQFCLLLVFERPGTFLMKLMLNKINEILGHSHFSKWQIFLKIV